MKVQKTSETETEGFGERYKSTMEKGVKLRCQRIGCEAIFTPDDNPHGSCIYHASGPLFRDGMKEWSCCKQRSHDFTLFLEIPGCTVGVHTDEKPVLAKPAPKPSPQAVPLINSSSKEGCPRCRQGFFCSDHASQVQLLEPHNASSTPIVKCNSGVEEGVSFPIKKTFNINEPQICKNKGCGETFKEKDNNESACSYHPGPAIFHDGLRGWKCCNENVREFDEFLSIPPCAKGWHNANPAS